MSLAVQIVRYSGDAAAPAQTLTKELAVFPVEHVLADHRPPEVCCQIIVSQLSRLQQVTQQQISWDGHEASFWDPIDTTGMPHLSTPCRKVLPRRTLTTSCVL